MKFTYKVVKNDKVIRGIINAESAEKVYEYLTSQGYFIIDVQQKEEYIKQIQSLFNKVGFSDIVDITRQIAIMLNAGLTLVESLGILKKQLEKGSLLKLIDQIDETIKGGESFSSALSKHKKLFNNLYISLVKAGEASGKLDEILLKLAENLEKERMFKSKIKGALIYPVIVIVGMLGVMFVMMTFVMPQLLNLYKDFQIDLPITTQILIMVSNFLQYNWISVIIGTILFFFLLKKYLATKTGKFTKDTLLLRFPLIKKIIKISSLVDATRTLSILIGSGVSILEAMSIIIETTTNVIYQAAFKSIYHRIEQGEALGKSLELETDLFPPLLIQMTSVGEQTGHLDETLLRVSNYYEMESELAIKAMTTLIEPAILIVLGLGVGFLVISVITPIYNLTSTIK